MALAAAPASEEMTKEQIAEYREAFAIFDKDGDGVITSTELGEIMRSLGINASDTELEDIINEIDLDHTGTIDFEEFLAMMNKFVPKGDTEAELRAAFKVFDRDNSGTISIQELKQVMKSLGEDLTDEQLNEMMREADKSGDGYIDYNEFVSIMMAS